MEPEIVLHINFVEDKKLGGYTAFSKKYPLIAEGNTIYEALSNFITALEICKDDINIDLKI